MLAGLLKLVYILEKDYAPAESGMLEYSLAEARFVSEPASLLAAQAKAFAQSYLRESAAKSSLDNFCPYKRGSAFKAERKADSSLRSD